MINIFANNSLFATVAEGEAVLAELADDIIDVQHPDSKRGLGKSRNDVNVRLKRFLSRCKLHHMQDGNDDWKVLGTAAALMSQELRDTKDALQTLEGIW
jgi:hypothetical protein